MSVDIAVLSALALIVEFQSFDVPFSFTDF